MPSMSTIRSNLDRAIQVIELPAGERLSAIAQRRRAQARTSRHAR